MLAGFDVSAIRSAYPALADGYAYLDGAAGTQLPDPVIDAIGDAYRAGLGNGGGVFPASSRSDAITAQCRAALADLTGGQPEGVILGPNMTTLTYRLAATLSASWVPAMKWWSAGSIMMPMSGRGCRPPPGRVPGFAGRTSTPQPGSWIRRNSVH
jgi:selenocysteine lyase/cysteine desulfurase